MIDNYTLSWIQRDFEKLYQNSDDYFIELIKEDFEQIYRIEHREAQEKKNRKAARKFLKDNSLLFLARYDTPEAILESKKQDDAFMRNKAQSEEFINKIKEIVYNLKRKQNENH